MSGGWLYEWRLVGWLEAGCMSGGWLYEWRLVVRVEAGWMAGGSDSDSDSEYFIDPRGEILFIPNAPCKVEMETSDKDE